MKRPWLFFLPFIFNIVAGLVPLQSYAHQSPNTLLIMDISPDRVAIELQLPLPELELAFGNDISKNPETLIERLGPQLKEYLKAHIHAYLNKATPWAIEVDELKMDKGKYAETNIDYWEVNARIILKPQAGENTRHFFLDYDAILHQVITHVVLVSVRSDWENGSKNAGEAGTISRNTGDNIIYPYEVNLEKGSTWHGFKNMLHLGMEHIKEGTDHLLFLIVLLLPAMLLINGKQWGKFGGTKYSIIRLVKITTAFTIGHSITLLIGALGWLKLPTQPVEILIAFSILVSAIHAIYPIFPGKETYVAAGFGLIHGLAFATILSNLKLGAGTLALSILGFNLGIELMQLFIIAIIVPWLILLSKTPYYKWIKNVLAVLAAVAALAWIAERSSGSGNTITSITTKIPENGLWLIISVALISVLGYVFYKFSNKAEKTATLKMVD